jgi:hypothetical protein
VISNDLLRKAVHAEYTLLRTPLAVLDEQIVSRYTPRGSRVQTSLARTIGVLDALAGRLLTDEPEQRPAGRSGADRDGQAAGSDREPADGAGPAASRAGGTSARPAPRRASRAAAGESSDGAAAAAAGAASDTATVDAGGPEPLPETEQEQIEELAEDLVEAEQDQTFAGELAEDDELRRVQAELRAKHTVEEREESS